VTPIIWEKMTPKIQEILDGWGHFSHMTEVTPPYGGGRFPICLGSFPVWRSAIRKMTPIIWEIDPHANASANANANANVVLCNAWLLKNKLAGSSVRHHLALELVSGADFWCRLMSRAGLDDLWRSPYIHVKSWICVVIFPI